MTMGLTSACCFTPIGRAGFPWVSLRHQNGMERNPRTRAARPDPAKLDGNLLPIGRSLQIGGAGATNVSAYSRVMSRRLNGHIASHLQRRARETAEPVAGNAPITLEVTKEAVRRIRRTLSRDEGEDLILRAYMSEDLRGHGRLPQQAHTPNWKCK